MVSSQIDPGPEPFVNGLLTYVSRTTVVSYSEPSIAAVKHLKFSTDDDSTYPSLIQPFPSKPSMTLPTSTQQSSGN